MKNLPPNGLSMDMGSTEKASVVEETLMKTQTGDHSCKSITPQKRRSELNSQCCMDFTDSYKAPSVTSGTSVTSPSGTLYNGLAGLLVPFILPVPLNGETLALALTQTLTLIYITSST